MSGNYQSRVFTFINQRTNRFKDTCTQGFRHIKVAVIWSGQALLYPFHLLAQTTKIFQPQITPPAQKPVLPPVSDINIEQALELVVDAGYPIVIAEGGSLTTADSRGRSLQQQVTTGRQLIVANEDSSNLGSYDPETDDWEVASYSPRRSQQQVVAKKPVIQGLSSLLVDRQLVLVTTENEILDILTSSQQQEIRRRIGSDLAIDWYQWSTGEIFDHHSTDLSLNHQATTEQLAISSSEDRSTLNLFDKLQNWLKNLNGKPEEPIIQANNFAPEQLDRIESKQPRQIAPASYAFTPQPPSIERFLDLPQLPPISEPESLIIPASSIQQTFTRLQPQWLKHWWSYYREYLSIPTTDFDEFESSQIIHQPAEFQLTKIEEHRQNRIERVDSSNRFIIGDAVSSGITHKQSRSKVDRQLLS
jgi:hypothetical protein